MDRTILLTGADGFTGQHFTTEAENRGFLVQPLKSDLANAADIANELSGQSYDYVVHLAAISAVTHSDELALYQINLFGTLNLLQALSTQSPAPAKVIVASSANIYGNATETPVGELTQPAPVNHYAMSKLAMEYMLNRYREQLPLVTVRPFNYTGAGQDERFVIPKLVNHFALRKASVELGNLSVEREFNDVRTVCSAYLDLLRLGTSNEVYNICSGKAYSLNNVIDILTRLSGHELELRVNPAFVRANEVHRLCGDPTKLEACLGEIKHPTLEETLNWMLQSAKA